MLVGFIHGVMNTDNMAISGETIDYGPCAFMEQYNPRTVFSSIDHNGRYAYRNQPGIAQWNLDFAAGGHAGIPLIDAATDRRLFSSRPEVIWSFMPRNVRCPFSRRDAARPGRRSGSSSTLRSAGTLRSYSWPALLHDWQRPPGFHASFPETQRFGAETAEADAAFRQTSSPACVGVDEWLREGVTAGNRFDPQSAVRSGRSAREHACV